MSKEKAIIEMVLLMEETILKYEEKERYNVKQGKADA